MQSSSACTGQAGPGERSSRAAGPIDGSSRAAGPIDGSIERNGGRLRESNRARNFILAPMGGRSLLDGFAHS